MGKVYIPLSDEQKLIKCMAFTPVIAQRQSLRLINLVL